MSTAIEPIASLEMIDMGNAPEFFITHIGKVEPVADTDCLRIYVCAGRSGGTLTLQYTAICPRHRLQAMMMAMRECLDQHPLLAALSPFAAAH